MTRLQWVVAGQLQNLVVDCIVMVLISAGACVRPALSPPPRHSAPTHPTPEYNFTRLSDSIGL